MMGSEPNNDEAAHSAIVESPSIPPADEPKTPQRYAVFEIIQHESVQPSVSIRPPFMKKDLHVVSILAEGGKVYIAALPLAQALVAGSTVLASQPPCAKGDRIKASRFIGRFSVATGNALRDTVKRAKFVWPLETTASTQLVVRAEGLWSFLTAVAPNKVPMTVRMQLYEAVRAHFGGPPLPRKVVEREEIAQQNRTLMRAASSSAAQKLSVLERLHELEEETDRLRKKASLGVVEPKPKRHRPTATVSYHQHHASSAEEEDDDNNNDDDQAPSDKEEPPKKTLPEKQRQHSSAGSIKRPPVAFYPWMPHPQPPPLPLSTPQHPQWPMMINAADPLTALREELDLRARIAATDAQRWQQEQQAHTMRMTQITCEQSVRAGLIESLKEELRLRTAIAAVLQPAAPEASQMMQ